MSIFSRACCAVHRDAALIPKGGLIRRAAGSGTTHWPERLGAKVMLDPLGIPFEIKEFNKASGVFAS